MTRFRDGLLGGGDGPECASPHCRWRLDPALVQAGYKTHGGPCGRYEPAPAPAPDPAAETAAARAAAANRAQLDAAFAEIARLDAEHKRTNTGLAVARQLWPERFPQPEPELEP